MTHTQMAPSWPDESDVDTRDDIVVSTASVVAGAVSTALAILLLAGIYSIAPLGGVS
ncbi:hypothetical protein R3Q06_11115 [Rhodococcus erythropolis]|uniref:hypothetical protein n=1 Tax=Rhodococcus erythropolis TaxID=1833 RepID=UPI00294A7376|nr:hypothetical protein [Rhodococcus erythropolis]MDV6274049.1 hypothetical protein [Rhodococcus erythropolis]